ncbi:elongator complex protein 6-like [Anoplophora glabripennis]|uniref:elongator complex protein 6-like n=1 Tax=Anoplophora glabripennis TaxID=217634 RepID=UPI00087396D2|nr:elongator complex protein 6-like [Anoplophora glabripennis]
MISLGDPRTSNPVLAALQIKLEDRIISVKENGKADSNFILTHLIKQILYEKNKICLVNLHNPLDHYQNVGKKLGYDLCKALNDNAIKIIEPLNDIVDSIGIEEDYLQQDKEGIVKCLYFDIKKNLDELTHGSEGQAYLIIDDVSHLLDLGVDVALVVNFVNYCVNLINNDKISVVLNSHTSSKTDEIISSNLRYIADVHVEVSPLKTGQSTDVTGLMTIEKVSGKNQYHYKAFDRGVKTFHPGESIYHLYK